MYFNMWRCGGRPNDRMHQKIVASNSDLIESGGPQSLIFSPFVDESGSRQSVIAGLCSLFLVGTTIDLVVPNYLGLSGLRYWSISAGIGYVYFLSCSVSFYPQLISNSKRRGTQISSANFCELNVLGFACYTVYNVSFY
jgi:hypothetical protein